MALTDVAATNETIMSAKIQTIFFMRNSDADNLFFINFLNSAFHFSINKIGKLGKFDFTKILAQFCYALQNNACSLFIKLFEFGWSHRRNLSGLESAVWSFSVNLINNLFGTIFYRDSSLIGFVSNII